MAQLAAPDLAAGRLVRPFGQAQSHDYAYYIVHKADGDPSPAIHAFTDWLLEEAASG